MRYFINLISYKCFHGLHKFENKNLLDITIPFALCVVQQHIANIHFITLELVYT